MDREVADRDTVLRDAVTFLYDRKDPRWTTAAWFLEKAMMFYEELTQERTKQVLQNLSYVTE